MKEINRPFLFFILIELNLTFSGFTFFVFIFGEKQFRDSIAVFILLKMRKRCLSISYHHDFFYVKHISK